VLASFVFARNVGRLPLEEARTIATTVLVLVGLRGPPREPDHMPAL